MHKILAFLVMMTLTSCTFNVSMAHTDGTATDVIDDTATSKPDISPTLTLPLTE